MKTISDHPGRDAEILALCDPVKIIAAGRARHSRCGHLRDDLISEAWIGAIEAVDKHDPTLSSLKTHADGIIRWRLADFLRSEDPLSRGHRRAIKSGEAEQVSVCSLEDAKAVTQKYL